jgi:hypothetical protein
MKYVTVKVWLEKTSQPLVFEATATYEKGGMFCVCDRVAVQKFPIDHIFRVVEDYKSHEGINDNPA